MSDIGIVIVTYNSAPDIGLCLDAALASGADVVVVDNASTDGTIAEIARRGAHLIANSDNRGFAAAVNQGFAVLNCHYVLVLNPDAVPMSSLEPLRRACDLEHAAGAGGLLLDSHSHPQIGFMARQLPRARDLALEALVLNRVFPGNAANRRYRALDLDYNRPQTVGQPAGAFLMVRRDVWEQLGGFDEKFFPVWFEDVDFCRRATDRGFAFYFTPEAVAKHTGGHSISRIRVELRQYYWYRNLLRYSARHFPPLAFRAICLAVVTGSILRGTAAALAARSLQPIAVFGRVMRLASRCCVLGWRDDVVSSGLDPR
jgi:N-acetylglucosaminyl-diphospho-decaprenol L-rhamnosyltransferase